MSARQPWRREAVWGDPSPELRNAGLQPLARPAAHRVGAAEVLTSTPQTWGCKQEVPTSPGLTWQLWWHIRMPGSSPEADLRDRSGGWCTWGDTGKGEEFKAVLRVSGEGVCPGAWASAFHYVL